MTAQRKRNENFVLVYSDDRDPSREETAEALDQLKPLPAEEVIPGTIRVTGKRSDVEKCMSHLHQWRMSTEKLFKLNSPYKPQLR
ncbi:hypothetical protein [Paracoccus sulfuroxidans]|uniref:Uncharacterized protein n=1 Tax=Paracoccus sulfuroxidans TaxID=384678 RepID=A0A562NY85_9RHOB|nr:hypothetical protein [Paracoccus sulfuroxidans]TWI37139.1 hypothetical protein IQ24_00931 [Paracoccus sulfuroxidans]